MNRDTLLTVAIVAVAIVLGGAALLMGCGGSSSSWTAADTAKATNGVRTQVLVEQECSDAGQCKPERVRALERSTLCGEAEMLYDHKQAVPDSGISCAAR